MPVPVANESVSATELSLMTNLLSYAEGSQKHLDAVADRARGLLDAQHASSVSWFDVAYEQRDETTTALGPDLARLLKGCTLMARFTREEKEALRSQLWEPVRFYTRCSKGLVHLFQRQERALQDLKALPAKKPPVAPELIERRRRILDKRREAILNEAEDYQNNKLKDVRLLVKNVAQSAIAAEQRKQDMWSRILARLEAQDPLEDHFRFLPSIVTDNLHSGPKVQTDAKQA